MPMIYDAATVGLALLLPAIGYLVRRVIDTDKVVAAHVAESEVLFKAASAQMVAAEKTADERHTDLKNWLVRIDEKLDRANGGSHNVQGH